MSDSAQVRQALTFFWPDRSYPLEIRLWQRPLISGLKGLDKRKKAEIAFSGFFDNEEALISQVEKFDVQDATIGIFAVMNTITKGSHQVTNQISKAKKTTKDKDIEKRQSLLIDIDPARASGFKKFCSTEDEKRQALLVRNQVLGLLSGEGWPDPCEVDSGNGYHLLYRIDLPNDAESKSLIRTFLKMLNKLLPDELRGLAEIDTSVHNASRVTKLPGTTVRKSKGKGRPWRESRIMFLPDHFEVVPEAQLQTIIDLAEQATKKKEAPKSKRSESQAERSATKKNAKRLASKKSAEYSAPKNVSQITSDPKIRTCMRDLILQCILGDERASWDHPACLAIMVELLASGYSDEAVCAVFCQAFGEGFNEEITRQQISHTRATYLADGGSFWTCQELQIAGVIDESTCARCPASSPEVEDILIDPDEHLDHDLLENVVSLDEAQENGLKYGVGPDGLLRKKHVVKVSDASGNVTKKAYFNPIADGFVFIDSQTRRENGDAIFSLRGRGSQDGHEFAFDMPAETFADSRKLRQKLTAQFGAANVIGKDLNYEAIQRISQEVKNYRLLESCKWLDGSCCVPGLDLLGDLKFDLSPKMPADLSVRGSLDQGYTCLKNLMKSWDQGHMAILLSSVLGSPLAAKWWSQDRYALGLVGLTGSGKTTAAQLMMSVYGPKYLDEANLLRWNQGSTSVALQIVAAESGCLPVLVDNYKALSQKSQTEFIGSMHAILEGSEKARGRKDAPKLRDDSKAFRCLPIVTGESFVDESSTLARSFLLEWQAIQDADALTKAQDQAFNLVEVGRTWLEWISGAKGQEVIDEIHSEYPKLRSQAVRALNDLGCINAGRIGSTVALIASVWKILIKSPLGDELRSYSDAFGETLLESCLSLAESTIGSNEAERFISGLRELIVTERCHILDGCAPAVDNFGKIIPPERIVGWRSTNDGNIWLYPEIAKRAVAQLQGRQAQEIDSRTLYRQLADRGFIETEDGHATLSKRDPQNKSKFKRFLVIKSEIGIDRLGIIDASQEDLVEMGDRLKRQDEENQDSITKLAELIKI